MTTNPGKFDIGQIPTMEKVEPQTLRRAGITACGHAQDSEEAREFVGMLGLLEDKRLRPGA